ncbi:hypothetical protein ACLOJK_019410 [Asimina triloba]
MLFTQDRNAITTSVLAHNICSCKTKVNTPSENHIRASLRRGQAVEGVEGDEEEGLEIILDRVERGNRTTDEVNEGGEEVGLVFDDGAVVVDDKEALNSGGDEPDIGGGGAVAKDVGKGVDDGRERDGRDGFPLSSLSCLCEMHVRDYKVCKGCDEGSDTSFFHCMGDEFGKIFPFKCLDTISSHGV